MSSKKVIRATVNYTELLNRCPPEQVRNLKILQEKNRLYKEKLLQLPEGLPKINWDYYKRNVRQDYVSMVDEFEKKYNEYKVPCPEDPYTEQIEEMKNQVIEEVNAYKAESCQRIKELEDDIIITCCSIPFDELTMEEFCINYPDIAPDFINRPTFWPHTPEEQIPGPAQPDLISRMKEEQKKVEDEYGILETKDSKNKIKEDVKTKTDEKAIDNKKQDVAKVEAKVEKSAGSTNASEVSDNVTQKPEEKDPKPNLEDQKNKKTTDKDKSEPS